MDKKILIAPSILSADFSKLGEEIKAAEAAGADMLHVDVMDGHFVPNITIGALVVKGIRPVTKLVIESHLMISDPEKYVADFVKAGSDMVTFHIESCGDPKGLINKIRSAGAKAAASIKPKTPVSSLDGIMDDLDMILVMTVEPGFGGQSFMHECVEKISRIKKRFKGDIGVDGGVNPQTAKIVRDAGANLLIAGTAVFGKDDYKKAIKDIRG
jgi:ribulose-phosphate 3-epimerase